MTEIVAGCQWDSKNGSVYCVQKLIQGTILIDFRPANCFAGLMYEASVGGQKFSYKPK